MSVVLSMDASIKGGKSIRFHCVVHGTHIEVISCWRFLLFSYFYSFSLSLSISLSVSVFLFHLLTLSLIPFDLLQSHCCMSAHKMCSNMLPWRIKMIKERTNKRLLFLSHFCHLFSFSVRAKHLTAFSSHIPS